VSDGVDNEFANDALTSVTIGNSVTNIGAHVFGDCESLRSIVIPSCVESIGEETFKSCRGLTSIVFGGNAPNVGTNAFESVADDCTVRVPRGSTGWGVEIPDKWNEMRIKYSE
jgi:hypothetical protein